MQIRVGYELIYDCPQPTPMLLMLNIHYSRASDLLVPDHIKTDPIVPIRGYRDSFGNWCTRMVAPAGRTRITSTALVRDIGLPDVVVPNAKRHEVPDLPDDVLQFLLGSRYCETDQLSATAWALFGPAGAHRASSGWGLVQSICNYVNQHIHFDYQQARPTRTAWEAYNERNQVFASTGAGKFMDVSHNNTALCGYSTVARGLACGDIDGDGAPDLLVNAVGEKARLFRNVAPNRGHWVTVRAFDTKLGRDAIGAQVVARTGAVQRLRVIGSGDSYLSASPAVAHFGLGSAEKVDEYEVTWPDGTKENFPGGKVDRLVELRKGAPQK